MEDNKCVHTEHCCSKHGCKYGHENCPVTNGDKKQSFPCEECGFESEGYYDGAPAMSMEDALDKIKKLPRSTSDYKLSPIGLDRLEVVAYGESTGVFFDVENEASAQYLIDVINELGYTDHNRETDIVALLNKTVGCSASVKEQDYLVHFCCDDGNYIGECPFDELHGDGMLGWLEDNVGIDGDYICKVYDLNKNATASPREVSVTLPGGRKR